MNDDLYREFENAAAKIRFQLIVDAAMNSLDLKMAIFEALIVALINQGVRVSIDDIKTLNAQRSESKNEQSLDVAQIDNLDAAPQTSVAVKWRRNIENCARIIANRISLRQSNDEILDIQSLSARTQLTIAQSIEKASATEDEDIYEVAARLVEECFKNPKPNSSLELNLNAASEVLESLAPRHIKLLGSYAVASAIIQKEFPDIADNFVNNDAFERMSQLLNPLLRNTKFSEDDYIYLVSKGCLIVPTTSKKIEAIHGAIAKIQHDLNTQYTSNWNERLIIDGLASSKIELGENFVFGIPTCPEEFWMSGPGKMLLNSEFTDYSPTATGRLIGYLTLRYLSNYSGLFYGFED